MPSYIILRTRPHLFESYDANMQCSTYGCPLPPKTEHLIRVVHFKVLHAPSYFFMFTKCNEKDADSLGLVMPVFLQRAVGGEN